MKTRLPLLFAAILCLLPRLAAGDGLPTRPPEQLDELFGPIALYPDALVALQKWPGEIKVIGPVSERQDMAPAFRPADTDLREAFNQFLKQLKASGEFKRIALAYYPFVIDYFPDYLAEPR